MKRRSSKMRMVSRRRQPALDLSHHAIHFFQIRQRDHDELVALMKADHAVSEQPHAVEEGIAAQQPAYWRAGDGAGLDDLREHSGTGGATESAEQRRADVFGDLALEFNSFALGVV